MELRLAGVVYYTLLPVTICILLTDVAGNGLCIYEGSTTDHGSEVVVCIIRIRNKMVKLFSYQNPAIYVTW